MTRKRNRNTDPPQRPDSPPPRRILPTLAVGFIALLVFLPTTQFDFTDWDDGINVCDNPYLNPVTADSLRTIWTKPFQNLYVPLVYSSFALDVSVWGLLKPGGFHATNAVIHAFTAMIVFRLLLTLIGNVGAAVFGALLFAIHPLQVEPVTWITGRKDVLAGFFSLLAVAAYVRFALSNRAAWYAAASGLYVAALLSKPAAVAVPIMVLALEVFHFRNSWKGALLAITPWVLFAAILIAVTKMAQQPGEFADRDVPVWQRLFVASDALIFYLRKLLVPANLAAIYDRTPFNVLSGTPWIYAAPAVPLALAIILIKSPPIWRTAAALVLAGVLPVLGLLRFEYQGYSTVADRYFYLSMFGIAVAASAAYAGLSRTVSRPAVRRWLCMAAVVLIAALAVVSLRQQRHWQNSLALWSHNVEVVPDCPGALYNYGENLRLANQNDQAIERFRRAVVLKPDYMRARSNLAILLMLRGTEHRNQQRPEQADRDFAEAVEHTEHQLNADPDDARVYFNAARTFDAAGDLARAEDLYREATEYPPPLPAAHINLGVLLMQRGQTEAARFHFNRALEIEPGNPKATRNLALLRPRAISP